MRLFTAIDLPDAMKSALAERCFGLPRCRWLQPNQLHLTLVFIGDINPAVKIDIIEALETVQFPEFELSCQGIGSFKSGVLWLGVEPCTQLLDLQRQIRSRLQSLNEVKQQQRKFHPHITLARLDRLNPPALDSFIALNNGDKFSFMVNHFELKSSVLHSAGAIHKSEQSYSAVNN